MLNFENKNRCLKSDTGYLKNKTDETVIPNQIYLGKFDNADNYEECSGDDYKRYLEEQKKKREEMSHHDSDNPSEVSGGENK